MAWTAGRTDELLAYLASGVWPLALATLAQVAVARGCRLGCATRRA